MRVVPVVLMAVASCGRSGFDALPAPPDVAPPPDAPPLDYCASVPRLSSPPTVDGVLEPELQLQALVPVGWESSVVPLPPLPSVAARFAIGYHSDGLYFFVEVDDASRFPASELSYCGDGVELYVDHDGALTNPPDYDAAGTRQYIAIAPANDTSPRTEGDVWVATALEAAWQSGFATFPRPGGYSLEAVLDASALGIAQWSLGPGGRVGVDISIDVSRDDGAAVPLDECPENRRLGQYYLRIDEAYLDEPAAGAPWMFATAFCTPVLE